MGIVTDPYENRSTLDTIVNGYRQKGPNCAVWNISNRPKGKYYFTFWTGDFKLTQEFELRS